MTRGDAALCGASAAELWLGSTGAVALGLAMVASVTGPAQGKAGWARGRQ